MKKIDFIIKKIKQNSQMSIENEYLLRKYIWECLKKGNSITFYNWECPPRVLDMNKEGRIFVNYCVDLEKIFNGERIDAFTEIPRVVTEKEREIKMLRLLKSLGLKLRFVKIIADTNAYYITPYSLKVLSKQKIKRSFRKFKRKIGEILKRDYRPIKTKSILFTGLLKGFRKEYNSAVGGALEILDYTPAKLIKTKTWNKQLEYIERHMGFSSNQQSEIENIAKRTIATYGAEGIIFDLLSKTKEFSNCVWLNIEEVDRKTIEITNCLRKRRNLNELPMIFPK